MRTYDDTRTAPLTSVRVAEETPEPVERTEAPSRPRRGPSSVRTPGSTAPVEPRPPAASRQTVLVRLAVGLLALGVVVAIGAVAARETRTVAGPAGPAQDIPALQVEPAAVQLGTVGQPVGVGAAAGAALPPAAAVLPRVTPGVAPRPLPSGPAPTSLVAWAAQLSGPTGIPARALQAYGLAESALRRLAPTCHLSWVTVAGLARIESNHGRFGGSSVRPDGEVYPPITGVPLDGTNGNTTILDGGGSYAQAQGPLQFIPSTWMRWSVDTHGTGRADVQNIDDAAVTAGRYMCAAGGDLATGAGWRSAVLAYNASDDYARRVYAAAAAYARGQSV